jgi:serine/threonine-protein phosphatase 2A regulatory subunit B
MPPWCGGCADKTVKLWRVIDGAPPEAAASFGALRAPGSSVVAAWGSGGGGNGGSGGSDGGGSSEIVFPRLEPKRRGRRVKMRRAFRNAHSYTMNSISCCSDGETFISSDDLRVYLWSFEREDEVFMTLDLKPDNLEDLTEVITTSKFHPEHCYLFGYSNSRGQVKLHDLREGALCGTHEAKLLHDTSSRPGSDSESLFDELLVSISDINFGGRHVFVRDLMTVRVWYARIHALQGCYACVL